MRGRPTRQITITLPHSKQIPQTTEYTIQKHIIIKPISKTKSNMSLIEKKQLCPNINRNSSFKQLLDFTICYSEKSKKHGHSYICNPYELQNVWKPDKFPELKACRLIKYSKPKYKTLLRKRTTFGLSTIRDSELPCLC